MSTETLELPRAPRTKRPVGIISIKPFSSGEPKFGLEETGDALFPETAQLCDIFCDDRQSNLKIFKTGLNEFAAEVQSIRNKEEKEAVIRDIRETVAWLENTLNANFDVSPETCMDNYSKPGDNFWANVRLLKSQGPDTFDGSGRRNKTYWETISFNLSNQAKVLNLDTPEDVVIYRAIKAGGYGLIAPSLEYAMSHPNYNFYLDMPAQASAIRTVNLKKKMEAAGYLHEMNQKNPNKMFFMAKLCAYGGSTMYKKGGDLATPADQLYEDIGNFLEGKMPGYNSKEAAEKFLDMYKRPIDEVKTRAIVKDALEYQFIVQRGTGLFYVKDNTKLGNNVEEVVASIGNPTHADLQKKLFAEVEKKWND